MKKKIILIIAVMTIVIGAIGITAACNKSDEFDIRDCVSYNQYMLYDGNDADMEVKISGIKREKLFIADGSVGEMDDFVRLNVRPNNVEMLKLDFSYEIVGELGACSGNLSKDGFGVSFSSDLHELSEVGKIEKVIITYGEENKEIALTDRFEGIISPETALEKAYGAFKEDIDNAVSANSFNREAYIKLINDDKSDGDNYYWFVSFIANKKDYWAVLIDTKDGSVISSRKSEPKNSGTVQ